MTFGSLFTGIGGFDLGLERAGMECRWQVEIDPACQEDLKRHWPDVKRYGDIKTIKGQDLEPVDLVCGGFPCQDLSQAGKRAGIEGSRSGLWFEFARLIGELRPRYVLIENVAGLLVYDGIRRVIGELARLGYVGCWLSVRASDLGASHQRKRVFIVAHRTSGSAGLIDGSEQELVDAARDDEPGRWTGRREVREAGEQLEDPGCTGNRRPKESPGLDRRRPSGDDSGTSGTLADAGPGFIQEPGRRTERRDGVGPAGPLDVSDTGGARLPNAEQGKLRGARREGEGRATPELRSAPTMDHADARHVGTNGEICTGRYPAFAPGPGDPRWPAILRERPDLAPALESPLRGMADGLPDWMDGAMQNRTKRLRRLGNAVVPQVAEYIGARLLAFDRQRNGV